LKCGYASSKNSANRSSTIESDNRKGAIVPTLLVPKLRGSRALLYKEILMRQQKGFSLIELLIVVAIILIIAAIAIPSLVGAKMAANEASAVNSIRTINAAQVSYQSIYAAIGYSNSLAALGPPGVTGCPASGPVAANACLIDFGLASATAPATAKTGYYVGMGVPAGGPPNLGYTVGGQRRGSTRPVCVDSARTKMA
jgi:type IV pilus assembly protein PilA